MKVTFYFRRTKRSSRNTIGKNDNRNQTNFQLVKHVQRKYSASIISPIFTATWSAGAAKRQNRSIRVQGSDKKETEEPQEERRRYFYKLD
jgi:hypothetical protein